MTESAMVKWLSPTQASNTSPGQQIRLVQDQINEIWLLAVRHSEEYARALDMTLEDINSLEHMSRIIDVETSLGTIALVPKNTCGSPYGDTWRMLLQPRQQNARAPGIGGGTSFFTVLASSGHEVLLRAIHNRQLVIAPGRIWP